MYAKIHAEGILATEDVSAFPVAAWRIAWRSTKVYISHRRYLHASPPRNQRTIYSMDYGKTNLFFCIIGFFSYISLYFSLGSYETK